MNKKAIALIIGGFIVLVGIIYFIFIYDFSGTGKNQTTNDTTSTQTNTPPAPIISKSTPKPKTGEKLSPEEQSKETATQLAIAFAERYGTSSSQADFNNLLDAEVFMTDSFATSTNKLIATERKKPSDGAYQSIVTKAMLVDFKTFDDKTGKADGSVMTTRVKTETDGKTSTYDQALIISLKKVANDWKVDSASWK